MNYTTQVRVRFGDVDAAGIVFYPRYFEMLNCAVEDWFEEALGVSFAELHLRSRIGVPTVKVACEFTAPSLLGDTLEVELQVRKIGRSSCTLSYRMRSGGSDRLSGELIIVCTDLNQRRAVAWPEAIRERIEMSPAAA